MSFAPILDQPPLGEPPATSAAGQSPIEKLAVAVRLADVQPQPMSWLWPGRIPLGKVSLVAGDPGLGKSLLTIDMAARVSNGTGWPDRPLEASHTQRASVVLLSAEDDLADTVRPRLDAAGADCSRIVALEAVKHGESGAKRLFKLAGDLRVLERLVEQQEHCRLVVIDPISAYLGAGEVDSNNNSDVRAVLAPLGDLASKHNLAVVCVSHLNKGGGPAIYRTMGSLAFVAAARASWVITRDRESHERRLMLPQKCNLGPDAGGLAYRVQDSGTGTPFLCWDAEPVYTTVDQALSGNSSNDGESGRETALDAATRWLWSVMSQGTQLAAAVKALASEQGFSARTIERARKSLGVVSAQQGFGASWVWIPPTPMPDPQSR